MSTLLSQSAISALLVSLESLAIVAVLALVANEFYRWIVRIRGVPGPGGRPIVGNLHQVHNPDCDDEDRDLQSAGRSKMFRRQSNTACGR